MNGEGLLAGVGASVRQIHHDVNRAYGERQYLIIRILLEFHPNPEGFRGTARKRGLCIQVISTWTGSFGREKEVFVLSGKEWSNRLRTSEVLSNLI